MLHGCMDDRQQATEILSESDCWELLDHADVGRLAVDIAGQPDIFPINFVVDKSGIVFRSAAGTKLAGAVLNRFVAFEIDGYEPHDRVAWSVVVKGQARDGEEAAQILQIVRGEIINQDGRLDAVVGSSREGQSGKLVWYEQPATATDRWIAHSISDSVIGGGMSLDAADMDQDGDIDIVLSPAETVGALKWYQWNGNAWVGTDLLGVNVERTHSLEIVDVHRD